MTYVLVADQLSTSIRAGVQVRTPVLNNAEDNAPVVSCKSVTSDFSMHQHLYHSENYTFLSTRVKTYLHTIAF